MNTIYPEATHGIVSRLTSYFFSYQGWPSVAKDENGTLYAVASGFRAAHICPFGKTVMYISKNDGVTWTPPIVINDSNMDDRDAGILYLGNGRLLVSWFAHPTRSYQTTFLKHITENTDPAVIDTVLQMLADCSRLPEAQRSGGSYVRLSDDYGLTWGEPVKLPVSAPHGPTLCKDGTLLYLGMEMWSDGALPQRTAALYKSCDGGLSWDQISILQPPSWLALKERLEEPHMIELPDGRLLGAFRIQGRFGIGTTVSEDNGKTWSPMVLTEAEGSPPHLLLHTSGALICSYGRRKEPYGVRAMVSYDLGSTWQDVYILRADAPNNDTGYPCTVELNDGSLLTVYYQTYQDDKNCSILYTKWKLQQP